MKKSTLTFVLLFSLSIITMAQIENPVVWSFSATKIANKQYEIHLVATVQDNWHIYAQDAGKGPEPTSFIFNKNPLIKYVGKVKEVGKLETAFDQNFNSTLRFYKNKVDFIQKVTLKSKASTNVKGILTYMVCNDRKCLPPKDVPFLVKIDNK